MKGPVIEGIFFSDGQSIHVGTQTDASFAMPSRQDADYPGAANTTMDIKSKVFQQLRNDPSSTLLLAPQFRMRMEIMAPFDHLFMKVSGYYGFLHITGP
jgi:hypothetical protein